MTIACAPRARSCVTRRSRACSTAVLHRAVEGEDQVGPGDGGLGDVLGARDRPAAGRDLDGHLARRPAQDTSHWGSIPAVPTPSMSVRPMTRCARYRRREGSGGPLGRSSRRRGRAPQVRRRRRRPGGRRRRPAVRAAISSSGSSLRRWTVEDSGRTCRQSRRVLDLRAGSPRPCWRERTRPARRRCGRRSCPRWPGTTRSRVHCSVAALRSASPWSRLQQHDAPARHRGSTASPRGW